MARQAGIAAPGGGIAQHVRRLDPVRAVDVHDAIGGIGHVAVVAERALAVGGVAGVLDQILLGAEILVAAQARGIAAVAIGDLPGRITAMHAVAIDA